MNKMIESATDGGLAARAAIRLRDMIVVGEFKPGEPLREELLASELGVSRNTLRESLRLLAVEGLAVHRQYKGASIPMIGTDDLHDIFQARHVLENAAIYGSWSASELQLRNIDTAVVASETALKAHDYSAAGTGSLRFHQAIVALLGCTKLNSLFQVIAAQLRLVFLEIGENGDYHKPWVQRERNIWTHMVAGKRIEACKEMKDYLNEAEKLLLDALNQKRAKKIPHSMSRKIASNGRRMPA